MGDIIFRISYSGLILSILYFLILSERFGLQDFDENDGMCPQISIIIGIIILSFAQCSAKRPFAITFETRFIEIFMVGALD